MGISLLLRLRLRLLRLLLLRLLRFRLLLLRQLRLLKLRLLRLLKLSVALQAATLLSAAIHDLIDLLQHGATLSSMEPGAFPHSFTNPLL